jgi:hypothetical protein
MEYQMNNRLAEVEMEQTNQFRTNHRAQQFTEQFRLDESLNAKGNVYACREYQRSLQEATDQLRRANRDLGEVAAFIAASLTTVTAVEAVINIADGKIGLAHNILQTAFNGYIALLAAIFILGGLRFAIVMYRRTQAEKELDKAKKGIYTFCHTENWPKPEE